MYMYMSKMELNRITKINDVINRLLYDSNRLIIFKSLLFI